VRADALAVLDEAVAHSLLQIGGARRQLQRTPPDLRDGVGSGVLASLERDLDRRGERTARRVPIACWAQHFLRWRSGTALGGRISAPVHTHVLAVFWSWLLDSAAGGYAGVARGGRLRSQPASARLRTRR
jgi:hypothetical protein